MNPERCLKSHLNQLHLKPDSRILVAMSGGGDSVALLSLTALAVSGLNIDVHAARVTHNIRGQKEEQREITLCKQLCADRNIPFASLGGQDRPSGTGGPEQAARNFRKQQLEKHRQKIGAEYIFYGHTADDQLETILMRLFSGAGPEGLRGIARSRGAEQRPLIGVPRSVLRDWLKTNQIPWAEDLTNQQNIYRRNRLRNELIPLISSIFPGWAASLNTLGERSAESAALNAKAARLELPCQHHESVVSWDSEQWNSASDYSRALTLWSAFDAVSHSGIPDQRFPWRRLKEARRALNARQTWNGNGIRLEHSGHRIQMQRVQPEGEGRVLAERSEVFSGFCVTFDRGRIRASLSKPEHDAVQTSTLWPLDIRFRTAPDGLILTGEFPKADADGELVYIWTETSE